MVSQRIRFARPGRLFGRRKSVSFVQPAEQLRVELLRRAHRDMVRPPVARRLRRTENTRRTLFVPEPEADHQMILFFCASEGWQPRKYTGLQMKPAFSPSGSACPDTVPEAALPAAHKAPAPTAALPKGIKYRCPKQPPVKKQRIRNRRAPIGCTADSFLQDVYGVT